MTNVWRSLLGIWLLMAQLCWGQNFFFGATPMLPRYQLDSVASVQAYQADQPFYLAVQAKFAPGQHAYFRNPGMVGEPMTASLQAPSGFAVEGPFWQTPRLLQTPIGSLYGYESPIIVWRITPTADAPAQARFTVSTTAQLCTDDGCLPSQTVDASWEMSRGEPVANAAWSGQESKVETLGDSPMGELRARRVPGGAVLSFRHAGGTQHAYFFSENNAILPTAEQKLTCRGEECELELQANDGKNSLYPLSAGADGLQRLTGILTLGDGSHARIDVPVQQPDGAPDGLWAAVVGLFLGGLLLNLMPCVFPVLGLKVMSFVSLSGGSRKKVVWHSLAFVFGILISFWLLGLALVVVSNYETLAQAPWHQWLSMIWSDVGAADRSWATWMENEWVVYGIMLLLLVLGLSMYGVFEIGTGATSLGGGLQQRGGLVGSFFQGLFVTLVATPCSAPYLGAAMPAAMAFPAVWMLVALTAMALGLALPYLILGMFPALVRLLPRPGAWMESLKQALSFFLFAAAAWMLDVYLSFVRAAGRGDDTQWVLMALVVFCAAFWVYGRWCPIYRSLLSRCSGLLVALALLVVGVGGSMPRQQEGPVWEPWSPQAMAKALEEGTPVFVDFTAKWCATCQYNKSTAYTEAVYQYLDEHDVLLMRADKTRPNEEIDAELRRLQRSAVPTNALYLPHDAKPIVTRELLTPEYLLNFFRQHLPEQED